jgi:hypothetical protein
LLGLLLTAVLSAVGLKAPAWLIVLLAVLAVITVAVYLVSYVHFMRHDPDALRSERYSLGKLAINRGVAGDNLAGIIEVEPSVPSESGIVPGVKGPSGQ